MLGLLLAHLLDVLEYLGLVPDHLAQVFHQHVLVFHLLPFHYYVSREYVPLVMVLVHESNVEIALFKSVPGRQVHVNPVLQKRFLRYLFLEFGHSCFVVLKPLELV